MKNLRVIESEILSFGDDLIGYCIDSDNEIAYILTASKFLKASTSSLEVTELERKSIPELNKDDVILFEYVVELGGILIGHKDGYFLNCSTSSSSTATKLYEHPSKLTCAKISPDQDLIALVDDNHDMLIMSTSFEQISTCNIKEQNVSSHKPVGVGWGSKETQFFGLDGRPSKESQQSQPNDCKLTEEELSTIERIESSSVYQELRSRQIKGTVIDWRADGNLLATLLYLEDCGMHLIKVWNRKLELEYISEKLVTIERDSLRWIPNGQYICCPQRRDNKFNEIALFEKNGLVHQRIRLPNIIPHIYIGDFSWSPNSEILSIIVYQFVENQSTIKFRPIIMLYTVKNFHYYLKFSSYLKEDSEYYLKWDPIQHQVLYVASNQGEIRKLKCSFQVTQSLERSTVAVVDADKILITPTNDCVVPPPMSAIVIQIKTLIKQIALNEKHDDYIYIITVDGELLCLRNDRDKESGTQDHIVTCEVPKAQYLADQYQRGRIVTVISDASSIQTIEPIDQYTVLVANRAGDVIMIEQDTEQTGKSSMKTLQTFKGFQVLNLVSLSRYFVATLSDGSIKTFTGDEILENFHMVVTLFDMTLRRGEDVICNSCSSWVETIDYLIFTSTDNTLHFMLKEDPPLTRPKNDVRFWSQPIETGATIVTVSKSKPRLILQMPRGNLEIIHPRILLFANLISLLEDQEPIEAVEQAKMHRIDMNFFFDYLRIGYREMSSGEVEDMNFFVSEIANYNPDLLSLMITELEDRDTLTTRYNSIMQLMPYQIRAPDLNLKCISKVNRICMNIELPEDNKFLKPRLLCLLKQKPSRLDETLRIIYRCDKDVQKEALKFLTYYVTIEAMFNEALGTYETDLVLMVTGASNLDPKEYLALLSRFNKENDIWLRRHMIDMHLKRYDKAFEDLLQLLQLESSDGLKVKNDILALLKFSRLYIEGIIAVEKLQSLSKACGQDVITKTSLLSELWLNYGDYLFDKRYYDEAGVCYSKSFRLANSITTFKKAVKCFVLIGDWRRPLALTKGVTDSEILTHLTENVSHFTRKLDPLELVTFNCLLGMQPTFTTTTPRHILVDCLFGRQQWHLMHFISDSTPIKTHSCTQVQDSVNNQSSQLFDRFFLNGLETAYSNFERDLEEKYETFQRFYGSLKKVISTPRKPQYNPDQDNHSLFDDESTIDGSDTSSMSSKSSALSGSKASTLKTRKSSKQKKSTTNKKKRISLKEGSRNQDIALTIEVKKLMEELVSYQETARKFSSAMYEFHSPVESVHEKCEILNRLFQNILESLREASESLWPTSAMNEQRFSLYRRFKDILSDQDAVIDNVDLEILIRPALPDEFVPFSILKKVQH